MNIQRQLKKGKIKGCNQLCPDREMKLQELVDEGKLLWDVSTLNPCNQSKQKSDDIWPLSFQGRGEINTTIMFLYSF